MSIDLTVKPSDVSPEAEMPCLVIGQAGGISYDLPCYMLLGDRGIQLDWSPQTNGPHAVIHLNKTATDNGTYIEQITHGNTIDFEGVAVRVMIWNLHPGERIAVRLRRAVDP
jgi:hypothetical protein